MSRFERRVPYIQVKDFERDRMRKGGLSSCEPTASTGLCATKVVSVRKTEETTPVVENAI